MKKMTRNQKTILGILALIALCMCIFPFAIIPTIDWDTFPTAAPTTPPTPTVIVPPTPVKFEPTMAQIKCERFIKASLKVPSSARFSGAETYRVEGKPANYHIVIGEVEAQNVLGVFIRSRYRCSTHYIPERSINWVLDSLTMD